MFFIKQELVDSSLKITSLLPVVVFLSPLINAEFSPLKRKNMGDVKENAMATGVPVRLRALDANGNSILVNLLSAFQNLIYRGEVKSNDEEAINNASNPGVYNHGAGLYGTGSGWHGILIVIKAGIYTIQIDIPQRPQDHVIFWRLIGGKWEKISSVTV